MALRTRCPPSVDNMLQGARRLCVSLTTAVHPPQSHRLRSQRRWTSDRPVARSSWDATHVADESFDESLTQFSDIHPDSAGGSLPPYYAGLNLAQPPYEESIFRDGVILIHKASGCTSFDVVWQLRFALRHQFRTDWAALASHLTAIDLAAIETKRRRERGPLSGPRYKLNLAPSNIQSSLVADGDLIDDGSHSTSGVKQWPKAAVTPFGPPPGFDKKNRLRVGHAGTLDPIATGLLVCLSGAATRKHQQHITELDKKYEGTMRLGESTLSHDSDTEIVVRRPAENISDSAIDSALSSLTGNINQSPPIFLAVSQAGERLYHKAYRGEEIPSTLVPRPISVFQFKLLNREGEHGRDVSFSLHCSKGTYVRSLAHTVGEMLGCGAHVTKLHRVAVGRYHVQHSYDLEEFRDLLKPSTALELEHRYSSDVVLRVAADPKAVAAMRRTNSLSPSNLVAKLNT